MWLALALCHENELLQFDRFFYWLLITISTVGYGDYTPQTPLGKWTVALMVVPLGLALFGLVLGRLATFVSHQWQKGVRGLSTINFTDHILIIGWDNVHTLSLIRLLQRDSGHATQSRKIALVVTEDMENPMPGKIGFVRVSNYSGMDDLKRANIAMANCIIINGDSDEVTMAVSLACVSLNPDAHIIAYFQKEAHGCLLKQHCPNIECVPSVSVEMMARSASDPGSSELHHQLLDPLVGMTQYSSEYIGKTTSVRDLFITMREAYNATLIGMTEGKSSPLVLNPKLDTIVKSGHRIHYISHERINPQKNHDLNFK